LASTDCGADGGTKIKVKQLASRTIKVLDSDDGKYKSHTFVVDVVKNLPYSFELTSIDGNTTNTLYAALTTRIPKSYNLKVRFTRTL